MKGYGLVLLAMVVVCINSDIENRTVIDPYSEMYYLYDDYANGTYIEPPLREPHYMAKAGTYDYTENETSGGQTFDVADYAWMVEGEPYYRLDDLVGTEAPPPRVQKATVPPIEEMLILSKGYVKRLHNISKRRFARLLDEMVFSIGSYIRECGCSNQTWEG